MKDNKWIYYVLFIVIFLCIIILCTHTAKAVEPEIIYVCDGDVTSHDPEDDGGLLWTDVMIQVHDTADILRQYGYSDDSEAIKALSDIWWREKHDLDIIAKVIEGEAGGCIWEQMVYTGVTVLNRTKSDKYFDDSVYDVVMAPGQYSELYTRNFHTIPRRVYLAAIAVMNGEHDAPEDLYWEAQFPQGKEIWKVFSLRTRWFSSDTYFCRGTIYD